MSETTILVMVLWWLTGWGFTIWFVNYFLIDRRWSDTGQEVGPGMMIMLNIVGPIMAVVMLVTVTLAFVLDNTGNVIRRLYGVRD